MLVCRDLEKAEKLYGFDVSFDENLYKLLTKESGFERDFWCSINAKTKEVKIENEKSDETDKDVIADLDFIYDMIKDGVIEKVEK